MKFIWFLVCLAFDFNSLDTPIEEGHEVVYEEINETEVKLLVSLELTPIHPNKTVDLEKLWNHLQTRFGISLMNYWRRLRPKRFEEIVLNGTLVLNGRVCFVLNNHDELKDIEMFLVSRKVYLAFKTDKFDFVKMKDSNDKIDQLVVVKKERSYSDCGNECFRKRFRLASYFYSDRETGLIHLNYSHKYQTINENKICFKKSKRENRKMVQLIANNKKVAKGLRLEALEAVPNEFDYWKLLREFDYWLHVIGLACSVFGLPFHAYVSIVFDFIASKVRKINAKIALVCFDNETSLYVTSLNEYRDRLSSFKKQFQSIQKKARNSFYGQTYSARRQTNRNKQLYSARRQTNRNKQLYSARRQANRKKQTDLNYQ